MKLDKILLIFGATPMINAQLKISVIIPVYNQAKYIGEAIESILCQTKTVDEIIVVNDGSTDQLTSALKPYKDFIRIISHASNAGVAAARNTGIKNAICDVILFQDADDISEPNRVELCLSAFLIPDVFYVRGMLQNFVEPGQLLPKILADKENLIPIQSPGSGVLAVKNTFFKQIGLFDESLILAEDIDWEMRAKFKGFKPYVIDELLVKRRLHANNISNIDLKEATEIRLRIFRKNLLPRK
jgi:glycosyltransferase involved in cell wall biosynthesis